MPHYYQGMLGLDYFRAKKVLLGPPGVWQRSVSPSPDGRSKPSFTSSPRFKNGEVGPE